MTNSTSSASLISAQTMAFANQARLSALALAKQQQQRELSDAITKYIYYLQKETTELTQASIAPSPRAATLYGNYRMITAVNLQRIKHIQSPFYFSQLQSNILLNIYGIRQTQISALPSPSLPISNPQEQPLPKTVPSTETPTPTLTKKTTTTLSGKRPREETSDSLPAAAQPQSGSSTTEEKILKKAKSNGSKTDQTETDLASQEVDKTIQNFIKVAKENQQFVLVSSAPGLENAMKTYQNGINALETSNNLTEATTHFKQSAMHGHLGAHYIVGSIYCAKASFDDWQLAAHWLAIASKNGCGKSEALLRNMLKEGKISKRPDV